ncbi:MAG: glycosyltransferase [Bacteroidales bacterium]|jgi:glycosyltransferase involved in cell wall biosynthesis|nr:glycosyltransferase [Bacteroidales bacterium]
MMGSFPEISVIITTFNHQDFIAEAIESVLCQKDCPDFEIIIGNDCSSDNTGSIIDTYVEKFPEKIMHIYRENNIGMQQNLKDCIERCCGKYIAFCEGDDRWTNINKLKCQYDCLRDDPNALMCFTDISLLFDENKTLPHFENKQQILPRIINIKEMIIFNGPSATFSCCMYKKHAIEKVPSCYYENENNFDLLFNLYILEHGYGIFVKKVWVDYRLRSGGLWQGKSEEEKKSTSIREMCRYNELFCFRYSEYFYNLINTLLGNGTPELYIWKNIFSNEFFIPGKKKLKISVKGRRL